MRAQEKVGGHGPPGPLVSEAYVIVLVDIELTKQHSKVLTMY